MTLMRSEFCSRVAPAVLCVGEAFGVNLLKVQSENLIRAFEKPEMSDNFIFKWVLIVQWKSAGIALKFE